MGVEGLWKILNSTKQIVNLESLRGKILAVDLSIWIYQALRGRAAGEKAHLKILFFRICKLLFYGVKPIFVFDGPNVPYFKQMTLSKRRLRKAENVLQTTKIRKKMLRKLSQMIAKNGKLPAVVAPKSENLEKIEFSDLDDEDSDDFQEFQILDSKNRRENLPENSNDFCDFQLQNLLAKNQSSKKSMEENRSSSSIDIVLPKNFLKIKNAFYGPDRNHFLLEIKPENDDQSTSRDRKIDRLMSRDQFSDENRSKNDETSINFEEITSRDQKIDKFTLRDQFSFENWLGNDESRDSDLEKSIKFGEITSRDQKIDKSTSRDQLSDENRFKNDDSCDSDPENPINSEEMTSRDQKADKSTSRDQFNVENRFENDESRDSYSEKSINCEEMTSRDQKIDKSTSRDQFTDGNRLKNDETRDSDAQKSEMTSRDHKIDKSTSRDQLGADYRFENDVSRDQARRKCAKLNNSPGSSQKVDELTSRDQEIDKSTSRDLEIDKSMSHDRLKFGNDGSRDSDEQIFGMTSRNEKSDKSMSRDQKIDKSMSDDRLIFENDESRDSDRGKSIEFQEMTSHGKKIDKSTSPDGKIDKLTSRDRSVEFKSEESRDLDHENPEKSVNFEGSSRKIDNIDSNVGNQSSRDQESEIDQKRDESSSSDDDSFVEVITEEEPKIKVSEKIEKEEEEEEEIEESLQDLKDSRDKLESRDRSMTSEIIEECKTLIRMFNLPVVESRGEAEAECARLEQLAQCQGVVTDDSDVWLFGAQNVYRHVFDRRRYVERYCSRKIQEKLGLTRTKMIKLAMLTGCDYTEGLKGVGSVTALEILSEFSSPNQNDDTKVDDLKEFRSWYENEKNSKSSKPINNLRHRLLNLDLNFPESFPDQSIMDEFLGQKIDNRDHVQEIDNFQKLTNQQTARLKKFARQNLEFTVEKIDQLLKPALENFNRQLINDGQLSIEKFAYRFFDDQDQDDRQILANSQRMTRALNRLKKKSIIDDNRPRKKKK